MSRWLRDVRLIPIVLIAVGCLFALKAAGLWIGGGYTLSERLWRGETITVTSVPATASTALQSPTVPLEVALAGGGRKRSWAQEMFGYPEITGSVPRSSSSETVILTGSAGAAKPPAKDAKDSDKKDAKADAPQTKPADKSAADKPVDVAARAVPVSAAERAVLERLLERRQELEAKARELELRETLLKAAEKNLEERLAALKKDTGPNGQRKDEAEAARFKGLVTMYETMKPKEAAKIFDRLDIKVLIDVAGQINPRRMSEIMASMTPEVAERLTVEFASRSDGDKSQKPPDLPKIDGKPSGG
jgi:flagellar motility protein MotE (MotC chaperone)